MIKQYCYQVIHKNPRRWLFYTVVLALLILVLLVRGVSQAYHSLIVAQQREQPPKEYALDKACVIRLERQVALLRLLKHHIRLSPNLSLLDQIEQSLSAHSGIQHASIRQLKSHQVQMKWSDSQHVWQGLAVLLKQHPQLTVQSLHADQQQVQLTLGGVS